MVRIDAAAPPPPMNSGYVMSGHGLPLMPASIMAMPPPPQHHQQQHHNQGLVFPGIHHHLVHLYPTGASPVPQQHYAMHPVSTPSTNNAHHLQVPFGFASSGNSASSLQSSSSSFDHQPTINRAETSLKKRRRQDGPIASAEKSERGKPRIQSAVADDLAEGLEGERRLVIDFESFGTKGEVPQTFGKRTMYIPDGLVGTHTAYEELWRFEIRHSKQRAGISSAYCITWRITNIKSGDCVERTETPEEAEARSSLGWTIASQIFREALRRRADQLEISLDGEVNSTRLANIRSLIRALRPKTFTQGPLVFGLKHRIVQEMMALEDTKSASVAASSSAITKQNLI